MIGDLPEGGRWRRGGRGVEISCEFVAARLELPGAGFELGEPVGEVLRVEGAVLERGQIPVGGRRTLGEVASDGRRTALTLLRPGRWTRPAENPAFLLLRCPRRDHISRYAKPAQKGGLHQ